MIDPNDAPAPLEPELRALLDDVRSRDAVDPAYGRATEDRVLERVEGTARSSSGGQFLTRRSGALVATVGLVAVFAGVQIFGRSTARDGSGNGTTATSPSPVAPPTEPSLGNVEAPSSLPTMHVDELPTSEIAKAAPPRPSASTGTTLAEEYRLVDGARAKIASRDYAGALRAIREHESRFASGQLVQERERLHVQALVETGRLGEARARAARFHAQFPNGLLAPSVARAIDDTSDR